MKISKKFQKMKEKSKHSQEEMTGFVLIIILVSVIALVFLAISIRKSEKFVNSKEVEDFLYSSLMHTTSCYSSTQAYDLKDLAIACLKKENCNDNKDSCDVLNKTYFELIRSSFVKEVYKGYFFRIYKQDNILIDINYGNKTSTKKASEVYVPVSGENINIRLELYS